MIKKFLLATAIAASVAFSLASCNREEWGDDSPDVPEGYIALRFAVEIPSMPEIVTRSVDPDGNGIQNMTLFCFDEYGLFISTATAKLSKTGSEPSVTGSFEAQIPQNTRRIHFLANQNMNTFSESAFRGKSEVETMAALEGSSGMMIYWQRFACGASDDSDIDQQLENYVRQEGSIKLVRNQAKISIEDWETDYLTVTGFAVHNTQAFGTVAPYNLQQGGFVWPGAEPFVTLPTNTVLLSDLSDIQSNTEQYVFESTNSADDPVSIIIKGHVPGTTEELYYRVMLIDDNGDQVLLRRNFSYILRIEGALSYGQSTFAEALSAPATNNVWVSISDEIDQVQDGEYILAVKQPTILLDEEYAGQDFYQIYYSLRRVDGRALTDDDEPTVNWNGDNTVAAHSFDNNFNTATGEGRISVTLLPMNDNEKLEGTLLVKKGRLQRKIKIVLLKRQSFVPAWVSSQVYGSDTDAHVTLMFTIPETCPSEMFPFSVLLSVNDLDVRSEAGFDLPIIFAGSDGYLQDNEWGYKYVFTVTSPGTQRVYFKNSLQQEENTRTITIESEHFSALQKTITFASHQHSITVEGLNTYNSNGNDVFPDDEAIYYRLVPQKRHALVKFDMAIKDNITGNAIDATAGDEFLLYSKNLDNYTDEESTRLGLTNEVHFYPIDDAIWQQSTNGRVFGFQPKNFSGTPTGHYSICLKTNCSKSSEIIRLASNNPGTASFVTSGNYTGNGYRSTVFELGNYRAFRLSARVNGLGNDASGTDEETVTPLEWTYRPSQPVDIAFDITSFLGSDGASVDPFGEEFEIYIDAPMLEIDNSRLSSYNLNTDKLKADPSKNGRFVYTVEADRKAEQAFGAQTALNPDASGLADQSGERKILPFKTKEIVSAGDIVICSNEEKVVFYEKTFTVTNKPIEGSIRYNDGESLKNVPANAFVTFARKSNGSRIGAITVKNDGKYELRLRKEYEFNWYTDPIEAYYTDRSGNIYQCTLANLSTLYSAPDIEMQKATE